MTMEEYDHSYAGKNAINQNWGNSFRNMNFRSTNVSPKVSARNSCTGDSMGTSFDYRDVFGGPPKYVSLKQQACQSPRKLHSFIETGLPSSGFSLPSFEIPVFGENVAARRRYVNDEFYDDIFNGDTISNASERSEICSISSRSASRNLSPVHHPLPRKSEYKSFSSAGSPLVPKPRRSANSSKTSEYPILHISPQRDRYKCSNNVSNASGVKSSPHTDSLDLQEMPFGRCHKSKKKFPYGKEGLKIDGIFGGFRRRSSKSRSQSFFEQGESLKSSLRESPARENIEDICSAPQNTSCSITSDDDWWGNTPRRINENNSELAEKVANVLEKARLSTNDVQRMTRPERLALSSPSHAFHGQQKVKCWRDWVSGPKGLHSNWDNGSSPVISMGSSFRESNIGASNAQEEAQLKLGLRGIDTQGIDSGEESDEFGSFVIEIDSERKETFAFVPEKDIQVDSSSDVLATPIKETMTCAAEKSQCWNEKRGLLKVNMPVEDVSHDKFRGIHDAKKWTRAGNHGPLGNKETSMQGNKVTGNGRQLIKWFERAMLTEEQAMSGKMEVQRKMHSAAVRSVPVDDQEKCIKEGKKIVPRDGYLTDTCLGLPAVAMEVSDKAERWPCDRPFVVCHETLQGSESKKRPETCLDKAGGRETSETWRKRWEVEGHGKINDHVANTLAENKLHGLEAEPEQAEKTKALETLDSEIRRWSAGKEANIRALLSTLQYVLWEESGWRPVPLIEIIEGAAVKKAYQKARLCVHPDKLQQKGATVQQKYIAKKVFDVLQAAWAIFNSMDPF